MKRYMECGKCGGYLLPQTFKEDGKLFVDGLECYDCWSITITSTMTYSEYKNVLEDYNNSLKEDN